MRTSGEALEVQERREEGGRYAEELAGLLTTSNQEMGVVTFWG